MGQMLVRNLDDAVIERLKRKAAERGTSLEQFARDALTDAARVTDGDTALARMDAMRARTMLTPGWSSADEIRAERDRLAARHDRAASEPAKPRPARAARR